MDGDKTDAGGPAPGFAAPTLQEQSQDMPEVALREDQIQNAVAFLSHPKVRGSAVSAKRSFLEKKSLTAAEIEEAFKRVPETPDTAVPAAVTTTTTVTPTYGANNLVTYTQQAPTAQTAASPQFVTSPAPGAGTLVPMPPQQQQMQPLQHVQQPVRWTQVVLGLGVAAAGVYGVHQLIAPHVTSWIERMRASRAAAAETEAQRTAALTAALESLAAGQAKLQDTLESLQTALSKQQQQQQQGDRYREANDAHSVGFGSEVVRNGTSEYMRCQSPGVAQQRQHQQQHQHPYGYYGNASSGSGFDASRAAAIRGWDPYDSSRSPRSNTAPAVSSASAAGNGPPNGFEVVPHNPAGAVTRAADGVVGNADGMSGRGAMSPSVQQQQQQQQSGVSGGRPDEAPHSAAFQEVMEMVRAGITPTNVRTDIDDNPPDPSRPVTAPQLQPRGKPWERSSASHAPSRAMYGTPTSAVADNFVQQQQQQESFSNYSNSHQQSSVSAAGVAVMADMEAAAAARWQSNDAAAGYDLSRLLGSDPTRNDAPWRPPPPPPPTLTTTRPNSSGSSSSRTAAPPSVTSGVSGGASSAAGPGAAEQVVANIAADAVRNVVAGAQSLKEVPAT